MNEGLILASASPRRAELLHQIGLKFEIIASQAVEAPPEPSVLPEQYVAGLAYQKAAWVAKSLQNGMVIGADTVVVANQTILGKPIDPAEAITMLTMLQGKEHSVFTGVAVIDVASGRNQVFSEETRVLFRNLSSAEIQAYVATREPLDKAGAYGIQGKGALLVEKINGCYFNVVGLPISRLATTLVDFGISIW